MYAESMQHCNVNKHHMMKFM